VRAAPLYSIISTNYFSYAVHFAATLLLAIGHWPLAIGHWRSFSSHLIKHKPVAWKRITGIVTGLTELLTGFHYHQPYIFSI